MVSELVKTNYTVRISDKQNEKLLPFNQYNNLVSRNKSTPRRCWLTEKTHKDFKDLSDLKYRHIISCSNSASQNLEIKLNKVLNKINMKSKYILNSLNTFISDTKHVRVERGFCLVTCDITKMFQNISVKELMIDLNESLFDPENSDCFELLTPKKV